jgi:hypothetical protein
VLHRYFIVARSLSGVPTPVREKHGAGYRLGCAGTRDD